jgi:mono/diheme cytochrome c family protein
MHPFFRWIIFLSLVGAIAFWLITRPASLSGAELADLNLAEGDIAKGEMVFWAAGCASCHVAPGAEETDAPVLSGGQKFASPFGTFLAPNISQDETHGIGAWDLPQFAAAVQKGVSPDGQHYFPAFPYTSYVNATPDDIAALYAFMKTLPDDATPSLPHEVGFPFNIRRSVGGWKWLFAKDGWAVTGDLTEVEQRGRYLSEALAHCAECHTPRNLLGGLQRANWMAGAPNPDGKGRTPNITPAKLTWSDLDVTNYLTTGFTPEFDTVGGHMVQVVQNLARLPASDREAITAYLRRVPRVD